MDQNTDRFRGVTSEEVTSFLSNKERIYSVAEAIGTPLHVVFPSAIAENICAFRKVFSELGVKGEIFYAAKANKSVVSLEMAAIEQAGLDVASLYELRAALSHGIPGAKIRLSGPAKDPCEMVLALQHGSSIAVDSPDELIALIALRKRVNPAISPRILLRSSAIASRPTRFGLSQHELQEVYRLLQAASFQLEGFTFHLDGYSLEERAHSAFAVLDEMTRAEALGFSPRILSIGGGFGVSYIDRSTWVEFQRRSTDPDQFFKRKTFSSYYPYSFKYPKDQGLYRILDSRSDVHQGTLAQELIHRSIHLHIEPGRSLLDQAGITLFGVRGVKKASNGEWLVQVDGNINHLSEQWFNTDFVPDPILISRSTSNPQEFRAAVAGNTCMESDLVTWRKVRFATVPQCGDLLVYANTAGYMMDSNESGFHRLPIPEKIAAFRDSNSVWKWKRDHHFSHLDLDYQY